MKAPNNLQAFYLYSDGHAVGAFEGFVKGGIRAKWVEIWEEFIPAICLQFTGRICSGTYQSRGFFSLLTQCTYVRAGAAELERGSENTKTLGIAVGLLEVQLKTGGSIMFNDFPDLISNFYTYQPEASEAFNPEATTWSDYQVAKIHRTKAKGVIA